MAKVKCSICGEIARGYKLSDGEICSSCSVKASYPLSIDLRDISVEEVWKRVHLDPEEIKRLNAEYKETRKAEKKMKNQSPPPLEPSGNSNPNGNPFKLKWYLNTGFIGFLFILSILIVPFIIAIVLTVKQKRYLLLAAEAGTKYASMQDIDAATRNLKEIYRQKKNDAEADLEEANLAVQSRLEFSNQKLQKQIKDAKQEIKTTTKKIEDLKTELGSLEQESTFSHYRFSDYDALSSEECKNEISILKQKEKELGDNAVSFFGNDGESKKYIKNNTKQILRTFNCECDNILINLKVKNIDSSRSKMSKAFESLNKIFEVDGVKLSQKLLEIKLEELNLAYTYELKHQQEIETQKAIKAQMVEEEKARRELERAKKQVEKDHTQVSKEINKLMSYMQKSSADVEKQLYADKIKELEEKLKELEEQKTSITEREASATAGFVYVISNIGSFGEDVYKIGMTRRFEPMDRIKELSSASVPFEFDVHAMIFAENAPELESILHEHFRKNSVNKINYRKEFFKVPLSEIEEVVKNNFNDTAQFTLVPVAKEYRETLKIEEELGA